MRGVIGLLYVVAAFAASGVGATALVRWLRGDTTPLWFGAALGAFLGFGTIAVTYAEKRGWIKIEVWPTAKLAQLKQRKRQLAQERARIISQAQAPKGGHGP